MSQPVNPDPGPSDIIYDDMTRAWRNGDYPLAWSLADALLAYLSGLGSEQPLTGPRSLYYVRMIHVYYADVAADLPDAIDLAVAEDARRERDEINRDRTAERAIASDTSQPIPWSRDAGWYAIDSDQSE